MTKKTKTTEPEAVELPVPTPKYVLQFNQYTTTAAEIGAVLNMLGIVINGDIYNNLNPLIKDLFKAVN